MRPTLYNERGHIFNALAVPISFRALAAKFHATAAAFLHLGLYALSYPSAEALNKLGRRPTKDAL